MKKYIILFLLIFIFSSYSQVVWERVYNGKVPYNGTVYKICCPDSNDCLVLMQDTGFTTVIGTRDMGKTWELVYEDPSWQGIRTDHFKPWNMAYPDSNHLYISYDRGAIRRSHDRGRTFDTVRLGTQWQLEFLQMIDSVKGMACDYTEIFLTDNGWDSYKRINVDSILPEYFLFPRAIYMHSLDTFDFVSSNKDVIYFRTCDGGETWDINILEEDQAEIYHLSSIFYINRDIGWMAGNRDLPLADDQRADVLFKTTDGGKTWNNVYEKENAPKFGLRGVVFTDEMNGVAVGGWGNKILSTFDGGDIWIQDSITGIPEGYYPIYQTVSTIGKEFIIGYYNQGLLMRKTILSAGESESKSSASVYPNPSSGMVTLSYEQERAGIAKLDVLGLSGRLVFSEKASYRPPGVYTERINGSGLAPGMYYYRLSLPTKELSGCIVIVR